MDGTRPSHRPRARRGGGILLELLLAIALFAAAASFTLSALRSAVDGIRRAELRARAFDLAATRLAELDAGLVAIGDLGNDRARGDGLSVTVELVGEAADTLSRARATVRDASGGEGIEPTIVVVHERMVVLREQAARRSR